MGRRGRRKRRKMWRRRQQPVHVVHPFCPSCLEVPERVCYQRTGMTATFSILYDVMGSEPTLEQEEGGFREYHCSKCVTLVAWTGQRPFELSEAGLKCARTMEDLLVKNNGNLPTGWPLVVDLK